MSIYLFKKYYGTNCHGIENSEPVMYAYFNLIDAQ